MLEQIHPVFEIAQYVADHEPATAVYRDIRSHLASCASCQELVQKLRLTEAALETLPPVNADSRLRPNLVAIIRQSQPLAPEWKLVPRSVWVPTAALMVITVSAFLLAPGGANTALPISLNGPILTLPQALPGLPPVQVTLNTHTLLTIGSALAAILSGAGLLWALSSLSPEQDKKLENISNQVAESAAQLLRPKHS